MSRYGWQSCVWWSDINTTQRATGQHIMGCVMLIIWDSLPRNHRTKLPAFDTVADLVRTQPECEWRLSSVAATFFFFLRSVTSTVLMAKSALRRRNGVAVFYLEVSVQPAVWARRRTGAWVWWQACRDMVWWRDLSLPAEENTGSPLVHTGTAGRRQGGLE